jgi:3-deoxy-D-manno-octulosonate 8-phosphate phosphatase (KDO 8-P phosphatase)
LGEAVAAQNVRCLCLDVDGVLTDGRLYVVDEGRTARAFHIHDGLAITAFQRLGGVVVICTGKRSGAVAQRAAELGIAHVLQGSHDKLADVQGVLDKLGLDLAQLAMVGDDLPDWTLMRACGWPIAVANAVAEVKEIARYVTQRPGGAGAVREAVEHLLRAAGRWIDVLGLYGVAPALGT